MILQISSFLALIFYLRRDQWLTRMTEKDWDEVMNVNLKGTWLMTQAFSRKWATDTAAGLIPMGHGGSIINISSIIGKTGNLGQSNYAASKVFCNTFLDSLRTITARHRQAW